MAPLALNVVPWVGHPAPDGWTSEELSVRHEARRILGLPELKVSATCVRVPVVTGHSMSVHATFARPIKVEEARQALVEAPSVVVLDDPEAREFPTPADIVGSDPTFVGRMRQAVDFPHTIEMFICSDNLRKGAALNTVQVAELVARDLRTGPADVDLAGWSDEVEQISQQYAERYGVERTSPWFLLKLQEEVGELTQAYLQVTGQGRDKGRSAEELEADLQAEVADVLAMLLLFARHHGVDVDEALERKWVAYRAANLAR